MTRPMVHTKDQSRPNLIFALPRTFGFFFPSRSSLLPSPRRNSCGLGRPSREAGTACTLLHITITSSFRTNIVGTVVIAHIFVAFRLMIIKGLAILQLSHGYSRLRTTRFVGHPTLERTHFPGGKGRDPIVIVL